MKRQHFRLGSVLKHYELQKQRAELDLQRAARALHEIDEEIENLHGEIAGLAKLASGAVTGALTTAGWMACCRRSEHLGKCLADARVRRERQAEVVAGCMEQRKRWAIAEETLLSLRRTVEAENQARETKADQVQLQETMLRRWLEE
jgi:hypothetical protein